jgi:hypothetical protein
MSADHPFWEIWTKTLRRWGMQGFVASLLEAAGPLSTLGAQFVYLGQPLLSSFLPRGHIDALATMLDNPAETLQFVVFLRERSTP